MRHITILVVTALAVVVASPLDVEKLREKKYLSDGNTRNSGLEDLFLSLIEELREIMVTGSDNIPVLDPFKLDEVMVDQNTIEILPGYVALNDIKVDGLSTFVINNVQISMPSIIQLTIRFILDASIPLVDINIGGYDLDLTVYGGSIFGKGDARLRLSEPRIRTNFLVSINLNNGIFIELQECRISVSLGSFDPEFTGMFNDPVMNDFFNAFLKKFVEELLVIFEDEITDIISDTALELGNQILADLDLSGILGI